MSINDLKFKIIMRWDSNQKLFRLFTITWVIGEPCKVGNGDGSAHSVKVTLALVPRLFDVRKSSGFYVNDGVTELDTEITILGVRVSRVLSYGGLFV